MSFKYKIYVPALAGLLFAPAAGAQYRFDQPVIIGKEQGLPTNEIRSIRKGNDGFIWMGTAEGLGRFDGRQVKMYSLAKEHAGLFDGMIIPVLPLENEVWAGSSQGIAVLDKTNESFRFYQLGEKRKADTLARRFNQTVYVIYQDRQNDIWIGTKDNGVWLYDKKRDDFKRFDYPPEAYKEIVPALGSNNTILRIESSRTNDSVIYAGTTAGLQEINKYTGRVRWYTYAKSDKHYQVALNAFRRLYHHEDGLLYVGSWAAGVNVFDPVKKTFTPLLLKNNYGKEILEGPIANIRQKSHEDVWISSLQGLAVYNSTEKRITWYKKNNLPANEFYAVDFIDEAGRVWFADINGIQYFDPAMQQFRSSSFEQLFNKNWPFAFYIISDSAGNKLAVCPRIAEGLFLLDKKKDKWTMLPFNCSKALGRENIIVRGFTETAPGRYIIAADEGLFSFTLQSKTITAIAGHPPVSFNRWGDIKKDKQGNLWICVDADGLIKWNQKDGSYRIYKKELGNSGGPGAGRQYNLFEDSRGNIWLSRPDGFSVHLAATDSIFNFVYADNPSNSLTEPDYFAEDRNGHVWISTHDKEYGFAEAAHPEKGIVKKFSLTDISGHFNELATDKEGNVWGYTDKELLKINPDDFSLSAFSFLYGVKRPDFFHFSFLPSGEMVFGGRNGLTFGRPAELKRNTELPVPYIFELRILNKPVNCSLYTSGDKLTLKHNQNFFSFYFSAKAYTMPGSVKFRYRLQGFEEWVEVKDNSRFANYTNVPPGDYTFQLQAANNEGIWNEKTVELPVHIKIAWWQSWWLLALEALAVAGIVYRLYRYRVSQVKKKEKLKTQYEKKLANVEMTALLAQMNPHFLFNSLNSIDSYIIKNESGKASEYLNNFARLMRLILQNSRSNYITLKDELETLDLYLQMESLRFKNKFQYEINVAEDIDINTTVIPPMLIQPYVENAIWHGLMHLPDRHPVPGGQAGKTEGGCGKVEITVHRQRNNLICIIQDNGIGREKATEIKSQKPGNHKRSMGMQITKDRIEMINKLYDTHTSVQVTDLTDDNKRPAGTRVKLIIPF